MADELEPCPFCGGADTAFGYVRDGMSLGCKTASCGALFIRYHGIGGAEETQERLAKAWNTRQSNADATAKVEAMRDEANSTLTRDTFRQGQCAGIIDACDEILTKLREG